MSAPHSALSIRFLPGLSDDDEGCGFIAPPVEKIAQQVNTELPIIPMVVYSVRIGVMLFV